MFDQDANEAEVETGDHPDPEKSDTGDEERKGVPYARFAEQNAKLGVALEKITTLVESQQKATAEQNAPKTYTATELQTSVDTGEITLTEAEDIKERQLTTRVAASVTNAVIGRQKDDALRDELAQYEKAVPELADPTSDEYRRVEKEYRHFLSSLGMTENRSTMTAAVRSVFGSLETLKAPVGSKLKKTPFGEGGGGDGDPGADGSKSKDPVMSSKQKEYYQRQINLGFFKDWNAVKAELSFTKPETPYG